MSYNEHVLRAFLAGALAEDEARRLEQAMRVDPELERRIMALDVVGPTVRRAFRQAPTRERISRLERKVLAEGPTLAPTARTLAAAMLVLGMAIGGLLAGGYGYWLGGRSTGGDWRAQVANYQALYVKDTVSAAAFEEAELRRQLALASDRLGRSLDLESVGAIGELSLVRAQVLGVDGLPLIQLAYRDNAGRPFALCITSAGEPMPAGQVISEELHGLATTSWGDGGYRFIMVGGQDVAVTEWRASLAQRAL